MTVGRFSRSTMSASPRERTCHANNTSIDVAASSFSLYTTPSNQPQVPHSLFLSMAVRDHKDVLAAFGMQTHITSVTNERVQRLALVRENLH